MLYKSEQYTASMAVIHRKHLKQWIETTYSVWRRGTRWGTSDGRRRCGRTSSWLHRPVSSPRQDARSTAGLHHSDGRGTARHAQPPIPNAISHFRPTFDVHSTHYTRLCSVSSPHLPPPRLSPHPPCYCLVSLCPFLITSQTTIPRLLYC